ASDRALSLAITTLGLSRHSLRSRTSGEIIFQELCIFANFPFEPLNLPAVIAQVADRVVLSGNALLRGDVVSGNGTILDDSEMEAFYVTLPIIMPDRFAAAQDDLGHGVALCWLAPITK